MKSCLKLILLAAACAAGAAHAQLTDTEQRIVAAVKQRTPAALQLLERSARINSGTLNPEGVREVGAIFRRELDSLGFRTHWADMPADMNRGGHLVGVREGTQGKRLLLAAYSKASEDAGLGAIHEVHPSLRGAGDVQFAAPYVPGIDGLGASGDGAHTDDEDLEIASIERGAIRAALLIYRLTR